MLGEEILHKAVNGRIDLFVNGKIFKQSGDVQDLQYLAHLALAEYRKRTFFITELVEMICPDPGTCIRRIFLRIGIQIQKVHLAARIAEHIDQIIDTFAIAPLNGDHHGFRDKKYTFSHNFTCSKT